MREGLKQRKLVLTVARLPVIRVAEKWVGQVSAGQVGNCAKYVWVLHGKYIQEKMDSLG